MKAVRILALAGISMLAMSNSCEKAEDASPSNTLTTGRLLKLEGTIDGQGLNSRPRWIMDISPLSFEGKWAGHSYQKVKVFNLPDTTTYKAGRVISFHYQVVPLAQQTPWKTLFEWNNTQPGFLGAEPYAELTLTDIQLNPTAKSE